MFLTTQTPHRFRHMTGLCTDSIQPNSAQSGPPSGHVTMVDFATSPIVTSPFSFSFFLLFPSFSLLESPQLNIVNNIPVTYKVHSTLYHTTNN